MFELFCTQELKLPINKIKGIYNTTYKDIIIVIGFLL